LCEMAPEQGKAHMKVLLGSAKEYKGPE